MNQLKVGNENIWKYTTILKISSFEHADPQVQSGVKPPAKLTKVTFQNLVKVIYRLLVEIILLLRGKRTLELFQIFDRCL